MTTISSSVDRTEERKSDPSPSDSCKGFYNVRKLAASCLEDAAGICLASVARHGSDGSEGEGKKDIVARGWFSPPAVRFGGLTGRDVVRLKRAMDVKCLQRGGLHCVATVSSREKNRMGGGISKLRMFAAALLTVFAVSFATPVAVYADDAPSFWSDPFGAIAAFFTGDAEPYAAGDESKVADPSTINDWQDYLYDNGHATTENIGRIWNDKSVSTEDVTLTSTDGTQTLTVGKGDSDFLVALSALSSMSNTTATITKPLDIVLVLDDSGSMGQSFGSNSTVYLPTYEPSTGWLNGTQYYALVDGEYISITRVNGDWGRFDHWELNGQTISNVTGQNDNDPSHVLFYERTSGQSRKIALQSAVSKFIDQTAAMNAEIGDEQNKIQVATVSYASNARTLQNLVVCEESGATTLKISLKSLRTDGAIQADLGLSLAKDKSSNRPGAQKVVIFFTDGTPTSGNNFEASVANGAIENSRQMKAAGVTVYSVGVFAGADPSDTTDENENRFMHGVSSNYPNATAYNNLGDRAPESNYYMAASNPEGLNKVFEDIFNDVSSGTGAPTDATDGFDAAHGGYITFTDKLDSYMKVDDFKSVVFAGQKYENPLESTDGNTTTYTFEGSTNTPIYPNGNLHDMVITVTRSADLAVGDLVTVKIPASLIPVRNFQVDTDKGIMSVTEAYPIRVFYGVSLKDSVAEALKTSNADGKISAEDYAALKTYADDRVVDGKAAAFYSNDWVSGNAGSTVASFNPSSANSFYFFTKDTSVFKDASCQQRASVDDVKNGETYYQQTYYESDGNGGYSVQPKTNTLQPNFVEFSQAYWGTDDQGVYIKAGAPHLTRANDFFTSKDNNPTGTATNAQNPTWAEGNKTMKSRLGNNGRLLVELPGTLSVTKSVTAAAGLDTSQFNKTDFTFDIEVKDAGGTAVNGTFPAEVKNAEGEVVSDPNFMLKFENGKVQHSIKPNETLYIYGLTAGSTYTVTEVQSKMPAGFTQTSPADNGFATGTIAVNTVTTATFTNKYSVDPLEYDTSEGFQVQKVLNGRDWRDSDSFTFNLTPANDAPAANPSTATVTKDSVDHKASFGKITFTKPGEYTYTIEEDNDTDPIIGIDYSAATYRVTVKVVDNGDGKLRVDSVTIEQTWNDEGQQLGTPSVIESGVATFTNVYNSDPDTGATVINGTKNYSDGTGGKPLINGMFTFKMEAQGGYVTESGTADVLTIEPANTPMPVGSENGVSTVVNNFTGRFTFPTIHFNGDNVGNTYVYKVSEVVPEGAEKNEDGTYTLNGMTYDAAVYTLEIAVTEELDTTDPNDEHVHIVATPNMKPEDLVFKNSYDAKPAVLSGGSAIKGTKTLNGRDMKADEFRFKLVPTGDTLALIGDAVTGIGAEGFETTAPAAENGKAAGFAFGEITFNKVGTYTFDMTEVAPAENGNGLTLDKHTGKVTVEVTLDADNAMLVASVDYGTYESRAGNAFVNTYAASMDYGDAGGLNVAKALNGRAMKANEFNFTIRGVNTEGSVSADEANAKLSEADKSFSNPESANDGAALTMKKLGNVKFTQADAGKTFTYEIKEIAGTAGGVTYDDAVYTVAIQVIDDGDGTMHTVTTVTSSKGGDPVVIDSSDASGVVPTVAFTNTYKAAEVSVDGANVAGTKTLDGRDGKEGETFGFTLEYVSGPQGGCRLTGDAQATVGELVKDTAKGFDFDGTQLIFSKPGTYAFKVTETSWNGEAIPTEATQGMTFDTHEGTVTVTVADDGTGKLKASTSLAGMDFVNTYRPADATFNVSDANKFYKQLDGRDWLDSDSFTFEMSAEAGTPMPDGAEGNVARVELTSPNSAEGTTVEFGFGNITYTQGDLAGALSKTFTYTVTEVQPANDAIPGMDYSGATFRIEVTVTDNLDGTLSASAKVFQTEDDKGETINPALELGEDESAVFFNTYNAENATVKLSATKNYTDKTGSKPLADGMFSVKIVPTGDNVADAPMPEGTTGEGARRAYVTTNSGTAFTIPTLTFDQHDSGETFTYQVSEVIPEGATDNGDDTFTLDGMTYDATKYDISIKVSTDTSDGDAHVKATVSGIPEGGMVFTNSYDADDLVLSGDAALKVKKTLSGRDTLQGEQFVFELKLTGGDKSAVAGLADDATTAYIGELKNGEAKTANFDALTFSKPGTYTFSATETMPFANGNGMTKDVHTSTVTVTVVDNNGKLELAEGSPIYENSQATTEADKAVTNAAAFTNSYTATGSSDGSVDLEVTKNLEGRGWMDGDSFEFTLAAGDDATQAAIESGAVVMPEDTKLTIGVGAPGHKAAFGAIEFNLAAPESTYTFTVTEAEGELGGVTYDTDVRTITVKVTDNGDGTLKVENLGVTGGSNNLTFTNTYKAGSVTLPGNENFKGLKTIDGRNGLEGETFEFTMMKGDVTGGGDWSAVTTKDGKAFDKATATATMHTDKVSASYWFDDLTFAKAGTYTFNVTETGHNGKPLPADGTNAMTYDRHTGTITVVVTDDGTGKLTATATEGSSADGRSIDFVNKYAPESVTYGSADEVLGGDKFMDDQTGGFVFADGQFTFVMRGQAAGVPMPEGLDVKHDGQGRPIVSVQNTKVNDDQGAYDFGEIVFEHSDMTGATDKGNGIFEKAFQYNIFEGDSTVPGVTQDNTAYTVTFTVTENQNTGKMTVVASAVKVASGGGENQPVDMDQLDFTNTHDADKISGYQNIFKTIEGRDFQAGDEFVWDISMTAVDESDAPMQKEQLPTVGPDISEPGADPSAELSNLTYTDAGDGFSYTATVKPVKTQTGNTYRFSTGKITYEHVGTYTYTVKEQASKVAGVTSDAAEYTVVVEITEENGALKRVATVTPEPSADGTLDFTNTYAATGSLDGASNLTVTKVLEGRDWSDGSAGVPADSFEFALAAGDDVTQAAIDAGTVELPEATTVTVDHATADHKAAFGNIEFTEAGEFTFKVTEVLPADDDAETEGIQKNGITYDESEKTVKVSVVDNLDGTLTATVTEGANPTFTNKYDSDPASVGTGAMFDLTKQLTGREGNAWADGDSFEFTLTGNDGAPMPADAENGSKTVTVTKDDVTDAANGIAKIDFGDIAYEATGTYTYTVVEANAGKTIDGVTHAGNTVKVTVTVTDNGVGGLVAAVTKTGENKNEAGEGASYVNTYSSTVNYGDVGGVDVTKVLNDRDMAAGQFTFTVTSKDKDALDKIGGKDVTMSSAAARAGIPASVTGNPLNAITFDRSDSDKDFVYTIDEVQEGGNGYTCDTSAYTVTVTPHDNGDGTMSITTSVVDSDGEHNMTVESATTADKKVAVVPFDNTYAAGPVVIGAEGDAVIAAHKTLKNDDIANYAGMFDFVVTSGDVTVATGTNAADGTVTFGNIEYTSANLYAAAHGGSDKVGTATLSVTDDADVYTFNYNVAEDAKNLPKGVSYESGNGTATVTVTDNRAGELSISVAYDNGRNGFEFVNAYGASEQAQLTLTGNKSIVGIDGAIPPALTDGMFGFTIAGSEGAPMPDVTYVKNSGATVAFGPITYTMENVFGAAANAGAGVAAGESVEAVTDEAAGVEAAAEGIEPYTAGRTKTFTYTITEDASKTVSGVTNDTTAKTVEVTVTDNGDGTLTATVTKVSEGAAQGMDFSFVNTYTVTPIEKTPTGEGGLTITKVWDKQGGTRELAEGDFSFAMVDADGNVVSQGTNDANGNVAMSPVKYTAEGQYTYKLIEVVPEDAKPVEGGYEKDGVFYVANSYAVTANVFDNHDGTLGITWTMKAEDGTETDTAEFVNVYSVNPTTVTFGAAKSLEGRAMKAGEFEFELKDADGKVLGTAKNAADGSIVFADAIQTFGNAGEYDFTVSEVLPNDDDSSKDGIQKEGVTYDETVYTAHVMIADDGLGNLQITELTYDGKAELPVFHNGYAEPVKPSEPGESLPITGDSSLLPIVGAAALGAVCVVAGIVVKKRRG